MELDYKSKSGQTIFDVSNIALYGLDNIVLGLLSPSNKSLSSTLSVEELKYNDTYIQESTIQLQLSVPKSSSIYVVKGLGNQSILDVCLMNYGNLDFLVSMLQENSNLVSINDMNVSLKDINFNANKSIQEYTVSSIKKKRVLFGTLYRAEDNNWILRDGTWDDTGVWDDTKTWID